MSKFSKTFGLILGICLVCLAVGSVAAQTRTIEIRNGEVLAVPGNTVIVRGPDGVKEVTIPEDFRFQMDGRSVGVRDLRPGMRFTAVIKTVETPLEMYTTEIRKGTVVHTVGSTVLVRDETGKVNKFTAKDMKAKNVVVYRGGKQVDSMALREGDVITAEVVTKLPPEIMTEEQVNVYVRNAPKPAPRPTRAAQAKPRPAPRPRPKALPKTGSSLPLVGLAGLILVAGGAALTLTRRLR